MHMSPTKSRDVSELVSSFLTAHQHIIGYSVPHSWMRVRINYTTTTTTTIILRPVVRDYPGEPVTEETITHPPSLSASSTYYDP